MDKILVPKGVHYRGVPLYLHSEFVCKHSQSWTLPLYAEGKREVGSVSLSDVRVAFQEGGNLVIGVEGNAKHTNGGGCINLESEEGRGGRREGGKEGRKEGVVC